MTTPRDESATTASSAVWRGALPDADTLRQIEDVAPGSSAKIVEATLRVQAEYQRLSDLSLRYERQDTKLYIIMQSVQGILSIFLASWLFSKNIIWPAMVILIVPVLSYAITSLRRRSYRHDDQGDDLRGGDA